MISTILLTAAIGQMRAMPTSPIATVSLADVKGVVRPIPSTKRVQVLFFVATDCPIANRMAPELSRIVRDFQPKGIEFEYVYIDPTQTPKEISNHLAQFHLGAPGILDKGHTIVKAVAATVTPEAVVLGKDGKMLYRGRINDLFLEHGRARKAAKRDDLKIALKELLAGRPISVPQTPALGCSIPDFS
jgi:thiol-disulfide isomerase/thioredoxin